MARLWWQQALGVLLVTCLLASFSSAHLAGGRSTGFDEPTGDNLKLITERKSNAEPSDVLLNTFLWKTSGDSADACVAECTKRPECTFFWTYILASTERKPVYCQLFTYTGPDKLNQAISPLTKDLSPGKYYSSNVYRYGVHTSPMLIEQQSVRKWRVHRSQSASRNSDDPQLPQKLSAAALSHVETSSPGQLPTASHRDDLIAENDVNTGDACEEQCYKNTNCYFFWLYAVRQALSVSRLKCAMYNKHDSMWPPHLVPANATLYAVSDVYTIKSDPARGSAGQGQPPQDADVKAFRSYIDEAASAAGANKQPDPINNSDVILQDFDMGGDPCAKACLDHNSCAYFWVYKLKIEHSQTMCVLYQRPSTQQNWLPALQAVPNDRYIFSNVFILKAGARNADQHSNHS